MNRLSSLHLIKTPFPKFSFKDPQSYLPHLIKPVAEVEVV